MTALHENECIIVRRICQQKWWQPCIVCMLACLLIVQWNQLECWSFDWQICINLESLWPWWACCLLLLFSMPFLLMRQNGIQHILVVGPWWEILEFPRTRPIPLASWSCNAQGDGATTNLAWGLLPSMAGPVHHWMGKGQRWVGLTGWPVALEKGHILPIYNMSLDARGMDH